MTATVDFNFEDVLHTVNGFANKKAVNDPAVVRGAATLCMVSLVNTAEHIAKLEKAVKEADSQHTTADIGRIYTSVEGDVIALPVKPNALMQEVVSAVLNSALGDNATPQILHSHTALFINIYENIVNNVAKAYQNKIASESNPSNDDNEDNTDKLSSTVTK